MIFDAVCALQQLWPLTKWNFDWAIELNLPRMQQFLADIRNSLHPQLVVTEADAQGSQPLRGASRVLHSSKAKAMARSWWELGKYWQVLLDPTGLVL